MLTEAGPRAHGQLSSQEPDMSEAIRERVTKRLKQLPLMHRHDNAELYCWETVRAYHAVWTNQLEKGRVTWEDEEEKVQFRQVLIWHPANASTPAVSTLAVPAHKKQNKQAFSYSTPAKPGTKACQAYTH